MPSQHPGESVDEAVVVNDRDMRQVQNSVVYRYPTQSHLHLHIEFLSLRLHDGLGQRWITGWSVHVDWKKYE